MPILLLLNPGFLAPPEVATWEIPIIGHIRIRTGLWTSFSLHSTGKKGEEEATWAGQDQAVRIHRRLPAQPTAALELLHPVSFPGADEHWESSPACSVQ